MTDLISDEEVKIKYMDMNEFKNEGFLQEVNRVFFHPLGLAMSVVVDKDGNVTGLGPMWDYRDDPEGMFFGESKLISEEKIKKVRDLAVSKQVVRMNHEEFRCNGKGIQLPFE